MNKLSINHDLHASGGVRRRRPSLVCAWRRDAVTGALVCRWTRSGGREGASDVPLSLAA